MMRVIGPAEDGGYYLLGLKMNNKSYFPKIKIGNKYRFTATMNDLALQKVYVLDTL
jgi:glycosyltransferase A (GT-A) superfamily protein (DUF2064 family)